MEKDRVLYFDILNIFACVCVIWLHCNSILYSYGQTPLWYVSLVVQVICHFAVPAFFMISGANLMNYREKYSTRTFACKRISRTLIPLLIWSSIVLLYKYRLGIILPEDFQHIVFLFLTSSIETVYWFFLPLFAIYLCIPVLSLRASKKNLNYFLYMALMGILLHSIWPFFAERISLGYSEYIIFPMAAGFLPYALLGYYLANAEIPRPVRFLIYAVGIACALYMYYGTIALSAQNGGLKKDLIDYESFVSYGYAAAVFLLFKNLNFRFLDRPKLRLRIFVISGASFGVYLIHMLTMDILERFGGIETYSYAWQLLGQFPVYLIALAVVLIVKKIPGIGKIIFP